MKLRGKTAFITGGDSGIGQQVAIALSSEGANVAISYHTDKSGAEATQQAVERNGVVDHRHRV